MLNKFYSIQPNSTNPVDWLFRPTPGIQLNQNAKREALHYDTLQLESFQR